MIPEIIDVGWVDPEYVSGHFAHSIAGQIRDMEYHDCAGRIYRHSASQPIVARNNVMQEFLDDSDSPWLWLVDADMVFDKGHSMKLWLAAQDYEADIVTGLTFIWKEGRYVVPSLFYEDGENGLRLVYNKIPKSGTEVAASGLASVLIRREVIETMQAVRHKDYRWFDFLTNADLGINGDEMTGIDVQFFIRAKKVYGYKMIVEPDAKAISVETMPIGCDEWKRQWQKESQSQACQPGSKPKRFYDNNK